MSKTIWQSKFSGKWFWCLSTKSQDFHGPFNSKAKALKDRLNFLVAHKPEWVEFSETENKFVPLKIGVRQ